MQLVHDRFSCSLCTIGQFITNLPFLRLRRTLDGPMASHDHGQAFGRQAQRSDEEPRLPFDSAADLADAVDDDDAVQAGPVVALLQPGDIVPDGDRPRLYAAVIAVNGFVPAAGCVLEAVARLLGHEEFD